MKKILIVDDEKSICISLKAWLEDLGYSVDWASEFNDGNEKIDKFKPSLVLLDIKLGDKNGLDFLRDLKLKDESIEVIMMTAYAKISDVVSAVKDGAFNYVSKPLDFDEMEVMIIKAFEQIKLRNELILLKLEKEEHTNKIIYKSEVMKDVIGKAKLVSHNDSVTVLITGETGTGKELIAEEIHNSSSRNSYSMVKINCGALPEQLIESELFGYEKSAFTGANKRKKGLLELANEGTIFLDEIGETTIDFQTKLLRVIEERKFKRVGGLEDITIDIRIVAATNKDLKEQIKKNLFREDLYYRLNVFPIKTPALRERKEDIILLAKYFIDKYNLSFGKKVQGFSYEAEKALTNYYWPGNVRELRNIIERMLIVKNDGFIQLSDLPNIEITKESLKIESVNYTKKDVKINLEKKLATLEKEYIESALKRTEMNFTKAAELLEISRFSLKRKYEKHFK